MAKLEKWWREIKSKSKSKETKAQKAIDNGGTSISISTLPDPAERLFIDLDLSSGEIPPQQVPNLVGENIKQVIAGSTKSSLRRPLPSSHPTAEPAPESPQHTLRTPRPVQQFSALVTVTDIPLEEFQTIEKTPPVSIIPRISAGTVSDSTSLQAIPSGGSTPLPQSTLKKDYYCHLPPPPQDEEIIVPTPPEKKMTIIRNILSKHDIFVPAPLEDKQIKSAVGPAVSPSIDGDHLLLPPIYSEEKPIQLPVVAPPPPSELLREKLILTAADGPPILKNVNDQPPRKTATPLNGPTLLWDKPVALVNDPAPHIHPNTPKIILDPDLPPILRLPIQFLTRIVSHLDYPSIIFLKVTCKDLTTTLRMHPTFRPAPADKFTIRRLFPSKTTYDGSRSPSQYCERCMEIHSFEHLVIWPQKHFKEESDFQSYRDFVDEYPRMCVKWAIETCRWKPGGAISRKCILCEKCLTPRHIERGKCAWNCQRCGNCVRRKLWSGMCVRCWRPGDGLVMQTGNSKNGYGRAYNEESRVNSTENREKICGLCLGRLAYSEGSTELCRCNEERHNSSHSFAWG